MLPAVTSVEDAVKPGAPAVWDDNPGNIAFALAFGNKDATDAAFAKARHTVSLRLESNRLSANAIEPRAAIGDYNRRRRRLHALCDVAEPARQPLAACRQCAEDPGDQAARDLARRRRRLRHEVRRLSRGRAGAVGVAPPRPAGEMDVDALGSAARRHPRPRPGRARRARARRAAARCSALRVNSMHAVGSHIFGSTMVNIFFTIKLAPGVYDIPALHAVGKGVFTNTGPVHPYRGAGRPEATYLIERLLDRAAAVIGIDPVEIRRRNFIRPAQMPHKTGTNTTYDSGDFAHVMDECLKLADWNGFAKRAAASKKSGKLRGRGSAISSKRRRSFNDRMELRFDPSGMVTIVAGTHSHGQGHATVYAQMVSEWLGVPFEQHPLRAGRHQRGADRARHLRLAQHAGRRQCAQEGRRRHHRQGEADGGASDGGGRRRRRVQGRPLRRSSAPTARWRSPTSPRRSTGRRICRRSSRSGSKPRARSRASRRTIRTAATPARWRSIRESGAVAVVRYAAVDDVGRVMNHLLCEGQVHGGVAQGVGQALMEAVALRRQRPARDRQLPGLLHAARRRPAGDRVGADGGALDHQSARREGGGRGRRHRRAAGGDRRDPRCAASRSASSTSTCRRRRAGSGRRCSARRANGRVTSPSSAPGPPG